jgi:SAM-dependent methyltransferase
VDLDGQCHASGPTYPLDVRAAAARLAGRYAAFARYDETAINSSLAYVLSFIEDPAPIFVDIGAGTGVPTSKLSARGPTIAIDISHEMLSALGASVPDAPISAVQADALRLPIRAACVSAVTFVESIHLAADLHQALSEAIRVTMPTGVVAVVTTLKEDLARQIFHADFPGFHDLDYGRHPSLGDIERYVERAGRRVLGHQRNAFTLRFPSASDLLDFVRSRPFFGLQQMSDREFEDGFHRFELAVRRKYGDEAVCSPSVITTVVLGV